MEGLERFYEILGLEPGASLGEVKQAYRDLAKVWHPDRFSHDPRLQQKAQEKLKEINEAYEKVLSYVNRTGTGSAYRTLPPPDPQPNTQSESFINLFEFLLRLLL